MGVIQEEAARILGVKPGRLGHWPWPEVEDAVTEYGAGAVLAEVTRVAADSKRFGKNPVAHFRASLRFTSLHRLDRAPAAAQPEPELESEPEPGPSLPGTEEPDDKHVYPVIVTKDGVQGRPNGVMPRRAFGHVGRYLTQQQADTRFGGWRAEMYGLEPRAYAEHYAERWGSGYRPRGATGRVISWWGEADPHAEQGRCWVQS